MSASGARYRRLDDLRAVAAALVFTCHLAREWVAAHDSGPLAPQAQNLGRFGVAIFFVISGLVIYRPFVAARGAGRALDLRRYALRRAARIVPAYWLALGVLAVVLPGEVPGVRSGEWPSFFGFANIYTGTHNSGLAVGWTLCIEVSFYVAAPLLALAIGRLPSKRAGRLELALLAGLALGAVAIRQTGPTVIASGTLAGYFGWFAIGMALARLSCSERRRLPARELWLAAGVGYVLLALVVRVEPGTATGATAVIEYGGLGLLAALVVAPAIGDPAGGKLAWLGDRSYGVYLWHLPIVAWLAGTMANPAQCVAASVALTLLVAHLSYVIVERPLMLASQRGRRAGTVPNAAGLPPLTAVRHEPRPRLRSRRPVEALRRLAGAG
jgi:peptidoglycan/LPS O-acetylase OafA/YrhL